MDYKDCGRLFFLMLSICTQGYAAPADTTLSLVISPTEATRSTKLEKEGTQQEIAPAVPKIYEMHVYSAISNRYVQTIITSKVKNIAAKAQEATFSVILPETAFISNFIMQIDGKNYTAYVKEKEEAKRDYDQAVASGLGAAHVAVSARDSNRFTVSINVEPEKKAAFYLTYEELLKREDGRYEQVINLHPGQPVKDLSVEVVITESRKITNLKALPLRSGNEIGNENAELDPRADIEHVNDTSAVVKFSPNLERQKQLAHLLNTKQDEGFSGQFVVQYDVEHDPNGGEVLIQDGYFVHFFAPPKLEPLPKHVVFVLDTSSSMSGNKIVQLREAMLKIVEQLHPMDLFNLVEFNTNVKVWDLDDLESSIWYPTENSDYNWDWKDEAEVKFDDFTFPKAYPATVDNIKKAKNTASQLVSDGATDIYSGLRVGLRLVELAKKHKIDDVNRQPIIIFLTDGEPTVRKTSITEITNKITEYNSGPRKSALFALSFGSGADRKFLEKLALRNSGFNKHIYEASDASLQLQDFYKEISSPLLADVTFKYEPSVTSLTKTEFPIHFGGSELIVAGWCGTPDLPVPTVDGWGVHGSILLKPTVEHSVSNIERLWAYLTVKQLLEKKEVSDEDQDDLKKKTVDLALKYSFVTPVSSLVVVKPNETRSVDTESAQTGAFRSQPQSLIVGGVPANPSYFAPVRSFSAYSGSISASGDNDYFISPVSSFHSSPVEGQPDLRIDSVFTQDTIQPHQTSEPTTMASDLLTTLPWLKTVLSENGTLNLYSGIYKLGLNETIQNTETCPKTPLNSTGYCTLLHACPQVHFMLTDVNDFAQHSCVLKNEFLGICCPGNSVDSTVDSSAP